MMPATCTEALHKCPGAPIFEFPAVKRKEVVQCLIANAVTSLGSPASFLRETGNRGGLAP
jgi:hypothetical protein